MANLLGGHCGSTLAYLPAVYRFRSRAAKALRRRHPGKLQQLVYPGKPVPVPSAVCVLPQFAKNESVASRVTWAWPVDSNNEVASAAGVTTEDSEACVEMGTTGCAE